MPIRNKSTRIQDKNRAYQNIQGNSPIFGVYIGQVTATKDISRTGRIQVFIAALAKDKSSNDGLFDCSWSSPFAGSTDPAGLGDTIEKYEDTLKSYGMWMVPPDIGNLVLVCFGDGNTKFPFILSCLYPDRYNHMVPGMPAGKSYSDPAMKLPVAEKNKRDEKLTHNDATRPLHVDLAESIVKQGTANDPLRGAGASGARRESPSEVFGILTPGPRSQNNFNHREGGHQFIMDDNINSRLIRLRTAKGNQLLLDDTTGVIYMINRDGTAWVELSASGDIHFFAEGSINFRAKQNFNVRADGYVNIEAGNDVNIKAAGDMNGKDEYAGLPESGSGPVGQGGNIRLESTADTSVFAGLSLFASAIGGNLHLNSAGDTLATANGEAGIQFKASAGKIVTQSAQGTDIGAGAGIAMSAGGDIALTGGPNILLNSGGAQAGEATESTPAGQLGTSDHKDSPLTPPEFDRQSALEGEPGATTSGKRTGTQNTIKSISPRLITSEPFADHYVFDPVADSESERNGSSNRDTNLPPNAANESGAPADAQTPEGTDVGQNYTDQNGNQATTSDEQKKGSPNYASTGEIFNNFKTAKEQKILEMAAIGTVLQGLKQGIPSIRTIKVNALGQSLIGLGKQLAPLEALNKQFAVDSFGLPADMQGPAIANMKTAITQAKNNASGSVEEMASELASKGIKTIPDGPGTIFEDENGNKIMDFANGIGPVSEAAGVIADVQETWQDISPYVTAPVNENQSMALAEFARSIGPETFKNSNVLEHVNKGEYHRVPNKMMGWVLSQKPGAKEMTYDPQMEELRKFQSALFQAPDQAQIRFDTNGMENKSFGTLATNIDFARAEVNGSLGIETPNVYIR